MIINKYRLFVFSLLSLLLTTTTRSQSVEDSLRPSIYFQASTYTGYLYAHHRSMIYFIEDYTEEHNYVLAGVSTAVPTGKKHTDVPQQASDI